MVDIRIGLKQGIPPNALHPYKLGEIKVILKGNSNDNQLDSLYEDGIKIVYQRPQNLKPNVISRAVKVRPGQKYSAARQNRTQANFVQLGVFKFAT